MWEPDYENLLFGTLCITTVFGSQADSYTRLFVALKDWRTGDLYKGLLKSTRAVHESGASVHELFQKLCFISVVHWVNLSSLSMCGP